VSIGLDIEIVNFMKKNNENSENVLINF